jgi:hypothetical protein
MIRPSENDYADTLAFVYSIRRYYLPTVSMQLDLEELNSRQEEQSVY